MARITPTVGRKLYYFVAGKSPVDTMFSSLDPTQPFDATVLFVTPPDPAASGPAIPPTLINVMVIDHVGHMAPRHSIPLIQEDDAVPTTGGYAKWMPYQVNQATKDANTDAANVAATAASTVASVAALVNPDAQSSNLTPPEAPPVADAAPSTVDSAAASGGATPTAATTAPETPAPVGEPPIPVVTDVIEHSRAVTQFGFGGALIAAKGGQKVTRAGWALGSFVYYVPAASYPAQTGVAKAFFGENALVPYGAYLAIKNGAGLVNVFVPEMDSLLAEDWYISN